MDSGTNGESRCSASSCPNYVYHTQLDHLSYIPLYPPYHHSGSPFWGHKVWYWFLRSTDIISEIRRFYRSRNSARRTRVRATAITGVPPLPDTLTLFHSHFSCSKGCKWHPITATFRVSSKYWWQNSDVTEKENTQEKRGFKTELSIRGEQRRLKS